MGCGSSKTPLVKDSEKHKKHIEVEGNPTFIVNITDLHEKEEMTGKLISIFGMQGLENYDLILKFCNLPRIKSYMNKYLVLASGTISDQDSGEFTNLFEDIKPLFDELFKRFNINYIILKDNLTVDVGSYKLECTPCKQIDKDLFLPFFFMELCLYPKSYMIKSGVRSCVFINSLQFSTSEYSQYRAACPEYNKTLSLYYCAKERKTQYIRQVIHHEFYHFVDWTDDSSFEDKGWRLLNRNDFNYGNGGAYEREWKPLDPECRGFINHYSTTGIEEDKSEIFQYLMSKPEEALKNTDDIIKKKVEYMKHWLCNYDRVGVGSPNYFENLIDIRSKLNYA